MGLALDKAGRKEPLLAAAHRPLETETASRRQLAQQLGCGVPAANVRGEIPLFLIKSLLADAEPQKGFF
jgi:hypothetical protein